MRQGGLTDRIIILWALLKLRRSLGTGFKLDDSSQLKLVLSTDQVESVTLWTIHGRGKGGSGNGPPNQPKGSHIDYLGKLEIPKE